jgi:hypothetical protein
MGSCNLDHSVADVRKKLAEQAPHLPSEIYEQVDRYLTSDVLQQELNEIFHLLKKYDLAERGEQTARNDKLLAYR